MTRIDGTGMPPPPQALCLSCGLCCNGTLFGRVKLQEADVQAPLEAGGIPIQTKGADRYFDQPCVAHRGGSCQVYADRPANCRKYRCKLLKKYQDGTVSWADARHAIGRAQMLDEAIKTESARLIPEGDRLSVTALRERVPVPAALAADPGLRTAWAPVMLRLAALLDCLHTHFQSRPEAGPPSP